jgi:predicted secreted hydrolase
MTASGFIRDGHEVLSVTGEVWFDRQWGDDVRNPFLKWMWFSIRLDDGTTVMLYRFLDSDDFVDHGTLREADGSESALEPEDFTITNIAFWTSPISGATYPVRWEIEIAPANLTVDVNRAVDAQELDARPTTLNVYWEGLCWVTGTREGVPVSGHAYVEMANLNLP